MLTITDMTVIALLVILAVNGAHQGFIRALVGPVSLTISLVASIFVYLGTKNFSASFLTAALGPFFFAWIIVTLLKKWLNSDEAPRVSLASRLGGQAVNIIWGSLLILLTISFLAFFPFNSFDLPGVSKDIRHSFTFRIVQPIFINSAIAKGEAAAVPDCETGLCSTSEQEMQTLASDPNIMAIMNDPRVQKMINDPTVQNAMKAKDYRAIMGNPAIRELSQDPQFLLKALKAFPKIQRLKAATVEQATQDTSR
jgi:hypothetical protein